MYVSRRYLREKWESLKWDMENVIDVYGDGDNATEALKKEIHGATI